jgi:hypothetical protein
MRKPSCPNRPGNPDNRTGRKLIDASWTKARSLAASLPQRAAARSTDVWMQFFLYEVVARIVAIYLCVDCSRDLWHGLVERKIAYFSSDWPEWLLDWSDWVVHSDVDTNRPPDN